ncbi:MAG: diguanylate cyclase [Firmicutes bacterium]|nr:diguanylate cyclase [Bacillota bacterium]
MDRKEKILIVDDSEINRAILTDMLESQYDIIEAENGVQALAILKTQREELSLLLLDLIMPELDGFGVLTAINEYNWINEIPVIIISAENASSQVERAYELGVIDFITRPFNTLIVQRRVVNTILIYAKQKKLISMVADQIREKEQSSNLMIEILSHIVEFRNGESGMHVVRVRTITELLLKYIIKKTDRYQISEQDISIISMASAMHDIGKISIPDEVLNKPGKLTDEEFAIMKTHSEKGAEMLKNLTLHQNEPLVKTAHDICRWHHERYDGRGYPDGLVGDAIPISAQVVALADVYDALTSKRVYKPPFSHEEAVNMILDGQCGSFNPLVLECLTDLSDILKNELDDYMPDNNKHVDMHIVANQILNYDELTASERTLHLLEHERMKYNFFADMTQEIQFEYTLSPAMVTLSNYGATKLGLDEITMNPMDDERVKKIMDPNSIKSFSEALRNTTPEDPVITFDCMINYKGEERYSRIVARSIWTPDEPPEYAGAIGKAIDIHESKIRLNNLERMASTDPLTGLLNHTYARKHILDKLTHPSKRHFAMVIFDLDHFKDANDTYGHAFGDQVLIHVAKKLSSSIRMNDIAARVGGDEFLIFLEYNTMEIEPIIHRIFDSLTDTYESFNISISMGIAETKEIGFDYDELFHAADQALYTVKRSGRGQYRFYDDSMQQMFSAISPIDYDENTDNPKQS